MIDTRNDYEVAIGTFKGAIDPETTSFREFPAWFEENRERLPQQAEDRDVLHRRHPLREVDGAAQVAGLRGRLPPQGRHPEISRRPCRRKRACGRANASCSTTASRSATGLQPGHYDLCHACRHPITEEDKQSPQIHEGHLLPALPRHDERRAQGRFRRTAEADGTCRRAGRAPRCGRCRCGARAQAGAAGSAQGARPGGGEGGKGSHAA